MLYPNFVLLLLWGIADGKPMDQEQGTQFLDVKHDPQLMQFVQEIMQSHDNNHPTSSWEEIHPANSMPCSKAEIINGVNYDYYLQYVDMNENFARDHQENIDHVDITDPMLHGCKPVIYCAEVKYHPYVRAKGNWHQNVNRKDDCFVLTQNGKTPYTNFKHKKQHKPKITENTKNSQNKTTTLVVTNTATPQPTIDKMKGKQFEQYEPHRHMYIAVHNNINMGGNDQIYKSNYKENITQQSNVTEYTTPIPINTTMLSQTFVYNTTSTTEIPKEVTTVVGTTYSKEYKNNSQEYKYSQEHVMQENHKANMKLLLDFLTSFKKKLCKEAMPTNYTNYTSMTNYTPITVGALNSTRPMTATTEMILESTTISPSNSYDDVIFVIKQNVNDTNGTSNISKNATDPHYSKPNNETFSNPDQVAVKTNNSNENVGPINVNNIPAANSTSRAQNSQKPTDMQVNGANNYEYRTNKSYRDLLARIRNNYYITKNGYILKPEMNKRRPYYRGESIQPYYYNEGALIPHPQRFNSPPRTFYWNNIVRRRYGKLEDNQQPIHHPRGLPLEICDSESMSMSKSQLESVDCD